MKLRRNEMFSLQLYYFNIYVCIIVPRPQARSLPLGPCIIVNVIIILYTCTYIACFYYLTFDLALE